MCGITGQVCFSDVVDINLTKQMAKILRHRGPDDTGNFLSPSKICAMAHNRLSIIDLSHKAKQPMTSKNGNLTIVFNGEIYNYRQIKNNLILKGVEFNSQSDTEVLLTLWGEEGIDCLKKIRGMFAFGVWDEREQSLTLVRDHFGIKPIYYKLDNGRLIFASEVKAFRSVGLAYDIDMVGLGFFLRWGSVPAPATFYSGIKSLPAGCWLKFSIKGLEVGKFWDLAGMIQGNGIVEKECPKSRGEVIEYVRETLLESVKDHLVSDVPVGAFLSGGVDSTAVVSLMRQAGQERIRTFSLIFDDHSFDESYYSRLSAKAYHTNHCEWKVSCDDFISLKSDFIASMDQPTIDGFNTFLVSRLAHENGLKVVTSGIGGDEFFAGYSTFLDLPRLMNRLSNIPVSVIRGFANILNLLINIGLLSPKWCRVACFFSGKINILRAYDMTRSLFSPQEIRALFRDRELGEYIAAVETEKQLSVDHLNGLCLNDKIMILETTRYLCSQLLPDSDMFSMANSLELRLPFVDRIVFERLCRLGTITPFISFNSVRKSLLVEAVGDLPTEIVKRKKMGFGLPFETWLKSYRWEPRNILFNDTATKNIDELFQIGKLHWSRRWALELLDAFITENGMQT